MSIILTREQYLSRSTGGKSLTAAQMRAFCGEYLPILGDIYRFKAFDRMRGGLIKFGDLAMAVQEAVGEDPEVLSGVGSIKFMGSIPIEPVTDSLSEEFYENGYREVRVVDTPTTAASLGYKKGDYRVTEASHDYKCLLTGDDYTRVCVYFKPMKGKSTKTLTDIVDF